MKQVITNCKAKAQAAKRKLISFLKDETGADEYTNMAVKVIIGIVLGIAILGGMLLIFSDTLLPSIRDQIMSIFDFGI